MTTISSARPKSSQAVPSLTFGAVGLLAVLLLGAFAQVETQTHADPEFRTSVETLSAH